MEPLNRYCRINMERAYALHGAKKWPSTDHYIWAEHQLESAKSFKAFIKKQPNLEYADVQLLLTWTLRPISAFMRSLQHSHNLCDPKWVLSGSWKKAAVWLKTHRVLSLLPLLPRADDVFHQPLPEQARLLRTPELVVRKVEDLAPGPVEKKPWGQTRRSALLSGAAP